MIPVPNKYKFLLKGVDITNYVVKARVVKDNKPVKSAEVLIKGTVPMLIDSSIVGKEVIVKRGFSSSDERFVFRGEVIRKRKNGSLYELFCACKMNRSNRLETDYVFDKDIDLDGGVGSEIVKSLLNNVGLSYSSSSVPTTTDDPDLVIRTFKASGSTLNSLIKLCNIYGREIFYNDEDDLVYFVEPSSNPTSVELETGVNVVGRIFWSETGEDIINSLTVVGGKQLDWTSETFSGTFDEVTLTAVPVDTEVIVNGNHLKRGVNSVSPNDFYTDAPNKKIIFTSSVTNPVVRYSYSVPIKVQYADTPSISTTYRVDKTILDTKLLNTDDAELYAKGNVDERKDVLTNAPIRVIGNNDLKVGDDVRIIDHVNDYDLLLSVNGLIVNYPYQPDDVSVGKKPSDDIDKDRKILERLKDLEVMATDSGDVSVQLITLPEIDTDVEVFIKVEKASADSGVLYWDNDVQGDWDDFDWGDDLEESYSEVYKEVGYD